MATVNTTCECGEEMIELPTHDFFICRGCGNLRKMPPKRQRGYWTAGGEDWWTGDEMEDGIGPSNAYYVSYQGDE